MMDQENYKKREGGKQLTSTKFSLYFEEYTWSPDKVKYKARCPATLVSFWMMKTTEHVDA